MTAEREAQAAPDLAIEVRDVGKMYRIYGQPQDRLKQMLLWRFGRNYGREFWALRDISFEIRRGETVGIIGRNGSGKSTLLQIIAGTLTPTEGTTRVSGRVAALLELGSGFNPEFTGRENVYLNGAILGLTREEMEARFDDIAAFADIGEFIDQPVKLYSSGMAVRLAFAVQAMVPKDVLIVDEALAVGDEAFQRKCMRTLEQFRKDGGTVLLVTHNTETIVRHCERCLFLHMGRQFLFGASKPVSDIYQRFVLETPAKQAEILGALQGRSGAPGEELLALISDQPPPSEDAPPPAAAVPGRYDPELPQTTELVYGSGEAEIIDPGMYDEEGRRVNVLVTGQSYVWRYRVRFNTDASSLIFGTMIRSIDGLMVAGTNTLWENQRYPQRVSAGDVAEVSFRLQLSITPGLYFLEAGVIGDTDAGGGEGNFLHRRVDICAVRVTGPDTRSMHGIAYLQPRIHVAFSRPPG